MKDVRLIISASADKADREIAKLAQTGEQVADRLSKAFQTLGVKSSAEMQVQRDNVSKAYDSIKNSGVATAEELTRAEKARAQKIAEIDEEMFGKRLTLLDKFKANWLGVSAAVAGAWVGVSQAWDLAKNAATSLQEKAAFGNLAASHGAMADSIIADLKRASGETIATKDLIQKSGTAMLMGIPANELSRLMEIARASSRVTGGTVSKAFEDISLAVARGSREILDNLGIVVSNEKAYQQYAASVGKAASELTDAEKKQAFMNATLAAGDDMIKRIGVTGMTAAEKMQRFEARMSNLKEILGVGLLSTLNVVHGSLNLAASAALFLSGGIFKVVQGIAWLTGAKSAVAEWGANADAAFGAAKQLAKDGLADLGTAADLVTGKFDPMTKATKMATDAADAAAEAEKKKKEALKAAVGAIESYSKAVSGLGAAQLKVAEGGFSRDLQRQEDYFKKNQSLAANLAAPLKNYLSVLDSVYGAQLAAQREIENVLKRIGAEKKVQIEQQVRALQVEKSQAEASLKGWNDYLGKLKGMHSQAVDDIKKKQEELTALQDFGKETQKAIQEKFFPKPETTDPFLAYYEKLGAADAAQAAAMELNGDKRTEALKKAIEMLKEVPKEVVVGNDILVSQQQAFENYKSRAEEWQKEAEAAKRDQLDAAQTAAKTLAQEMTRAETAMATLEQKIVDLDGRIISLSRSVTLTLDDQVTAGVENIRRALSSLGSGVNVSGGASYVNVIPGAVSLGSPSPFALDSYDKGTSYVPKTGLYQLHQGERVVTAADNARGNYGGSTTISFGENAIQVLVQGGSETADEIARKLVPSLKKYLGRNIAA
jgi:hypothetical protein